jgi:histidinol-phosphate aminotransferase
VSDPLALARADLVELPAYGRGSGRAGLRLDANEVPWRPAGDRTRAGLNRYPPVRAEAIERRLAEIYGVAPASVLATRGSDEAIDLLVRAFCRPAADAVVVLPPAFGMYALAARIQGARVVPVERRRAAGFAIDVEAVAARLAGVKLVFVADPDNPTGRRATPEEIAGLARATAGRALLVVDEAYGEFAGGPSAAARLAEWPHLVVLRTLSKAHALAGARLGAAIAHPALIELLGRILPPFALAQPSLEAAAAQLAPRALAATRRRIRALVAERRRLARALAALPGVARLFPSAANFVLVAFADVAAASAALAAADIAARHYEEPDLADCLRLTVGAPAENRRLLAALRAA